MTWHVNGSLKGLTCFHGADAVIRGPQKGPCYKRILQQVRSLYEWRAWEKDNVER